MGKSIVLLITVLPIISFRWKSSQENKETKWCCLEGFFILLSFSLFPLHCHLQLERSMSYVMLQFLDVLGAASGKRQVRSKATQADNGPVLFQVLIILPSSSPAQACSSGMRHAACGKAMTMSGLLKPIAMRARKESLRVASAKGVEVSDVVGQWTDLTKKYSIINKKNVA